ncbi:MAG: response regulator [Candidatus Schekmanbacteria bacterium]|nr:response regulator [Candidatus Schekmanbacteria bacterium]
MERADKPTILAVDDCEELLDWLEIDLTSRGFRVLTALNGESALTVVRENPIDIMILDVMMPGSQRLVEFLERNPVYLEGSALRLDVGLIVREGGRFRSLWEVIADDTVVPPLAGELGSSRPSPVQGAKAVFTLAGSEQFCAEHGVIRLSFDGFTVCQLISSNTRLPRSPVIYLFTAGGIGSEGERERRAAEVGAEQYVLKNEYYDRLIPLLEQHLPTEVVRVPRASTTTASSAPGTGK